MYTEICIVCMCTYIDIDTPKHGVHRRGDGRRQNKNKLDENKQNAAGGILTRECHLHATVQSFLCLTKHGKHLSSHLYR